AKYVFVLDQGAARMREVKTGFVNWDRSEVVSGLAPEDTLIVPLQFQDETPVTAGSKVVLYEDGK
ncbi:MAG TPA: hypothetical protein VEN81_04665, partial [Planctomycetota bacterium]|nr:hypothetical protein [Planctomycetota bacterium]